MKSNGFILSEQIIALGMMMIGIVFFTMSIESLGMQQKRMEERLIAARMCKEHLQSGQATPHSGYHLAQTGHYLRVSYCHHKVLEID